jgi:anti-sigma factor RsiW
VTSDERDITCQQFVALVTDYLEGSLTPATAQAVEAHLAACPHCEEYLDEIRQTIMALGRVPVRSLSERTRDGIVAAFRDYPRS